MGFALARRAAAPLLDGSTKRGVCHVISHGFQAHFSGWLQVKKSRSDFAGSTTHEHYVDRDLK